MYMLCANFKPGQSSNPQACIYRLFAVTFTTCLCVELTVHMITFYSLT